MIFIFLPVGSHLYSSMDHTKLILPYFTIVDFLVQKKRKEYYAFCGETTVVRLVE